ncbi:PQQ-dependent sugar dehydrogenase [Hoyosella altamirensis]|nr:PQQ-dependent sugar dehydrogenase [Hoyosella altamirensis]
MRVIRWAAAAVFAAILAGCAQDPSPSRSVPVDENATAVSALAVELQVPWDVAFLPDGDALVTERDSGRVLLIGDAGTTTEVVQIDDVDNRGEGGLMGIAVSPEFADTAHVFVYYTTDADNRIVRYTFSEGALTDPQPTLAGIPSGTIHNGGALTFGPDGYLYAATGDAGQQAFSQNLNSLGGKILRLTTDGRPAPGNPFPESAVLSYGHRNIQGLAFDSRDQLWASEFGAFSWDELNLIVPGGNYGWPEIEGIGGEDRFIDPVEVWRPAEASPAGLAIIDDVLYMAALRGNRLWEIPINNGATGEPRASLGGYGRLRAAVAAPDGSLWVTTSNRDGRGRAAPEDDQILRVNFD